MAFRLTADFRALTGQSHAIVRGRKEKPSEDESRHLSWDTLPELYALKPHHTALTFQCDLVISPLVALSASITLKSAKMGSELGLPPACSVIHPTARTHGALVWTQEAHFQGLEGVEFMEKE